MKMKCTLTMILLIALSCPTFAEQSDLTQEDIQFIEKLKKIGLIPQTTPTEFKTHESVSRIKEYLSKTGELESIVEEPDLRMSTPEKTFDLYKESLISSNIELAIKCLTPQYAKKQREVFKALGKEKLKVIGENMQPIQKIRQNDHDAEFRIKRNENGIEISYSVYFANNNGNWKIDQF